MSIKEMISEHPSVGADYNEQLAEAVKHAMYCAAICNSCADACSAEDGDMAACIRSCSDCSDICTATYRVATRRTAGNVAVIEQQLRDRLLAILRAGVNAELIEPRPDDLLLFGVQSALHGAVRLAWRSGSGTGRPERTAELTRFILMGILTKQGRKQLKKGLALSP